MRTAPFLLTALMVALGSVSARQQAPAASAKAADVLGTAEQRTSASPERWTGLKAGDTVPATGAVRTQADSAVLLSLPDQHVIRVGENTTMEVREIGANHVFSFALLKGRIWSFVDKMTKPAKYEVESGSVILGVSGTLFSVARDDQADETEASVDDGEVRLRKAKVQKSIQKGAQIRVMKGRLAFAIARPQTKATRAMWKSIGSAESWARHGGPLHLNREVEARAREVQAERRRERARAGAAGSRRRR